MRLYGKATTVHPRDAAWSELAPLFPHYTGARQVFTLALDLVQTSCGYGVPFYELKGERPTLTKWADNRGPDGIREYWAENNVQSMDAKDTGIFDS